MVQVNEKVVKRKREVSLTPPPSKLKEIDDFYNNFVMIFVMILMSFLVAQIDIENAQNVLRLKNQLDAKTSHYKKQTEVIFNF